MSTQPSPASVDEQRAELVQFLMDRAGDADREVEQALLELRQSLDHLLVAFARLRDEKRLLMDETLVLSEDLQAVGDRIDEFRKTLTAFHGSIAVAIADQVRVTIDTAPLVTGDRAFVPFLIAKTRELQGPQLDTYLRPLFERSGLTDRLMTWNERNSNRLADGVEPEAPAAPDRVPPAKPEDLTRAMIEHLLANECSPATMRAAAAWGRLMAVVGTRPDPESPHYRAALDDLGHALGELDEASHTAFFAAMRHASEADLAAGPD